MHGTQVRAVLGYTPDTALDVSFKVAAGDPLKVQLDGFSSFDSAMHCARYNRSAAAATCVEGDRCAATATRASAAARS